MEWAADAVEDMTRLRRGWHWRGARPASWPEASSAIPDRPSDLSWARQEPVRSIRFLIQRGLMMPFTELMTHPKVEGSEWVEELERPAILVNKWLGPLWRNWPVLAIAYLGVLFGLTSGVYLPHTALLLVLMPWPPLLMFREPEPVRVVSAVQSTMPEAEVAMEPVTFSVPSVMVR